MLLSGHQSEISSCKFHPNGQTLMSAGFDRNICMLIYETDIIFVLNDFL